MPKAQLGDLPAKHLIERLLRKAYSPYVESTVASHLTASVPFEVLGGPAVLSTADSTFTNPTAVQPHTALALQNQPGSSRLARWNDSTWRQDAACAHMDTLIFFPVGETGGMTQQVDLAKKICSSCPVREQCLEFAIATIQNDGIWGGTTEDERRLIKRARRAAARRSATKAA
jgi:WhiB family transcriptional regulator, redox-sensing transcriptional regulator